ncbi:MAG: hypothetical protein AAF960_23320, partial [Bacteroidota bacterium]
DINSIAPIRSAVMADLQKYLGWDSDRLAKENAHLDELIADATTYYEEEMKEAVAVEAVLYA